MVRHFHRARSTPEGSLVKGPLAAASSLEVDASSQKIGSCEGSLCDASSPETSSYEPSIFDANAGSQDDINPVASSLEAALKEGELTAVAAEACVSSRLAWLLNTESPSYLDSKHRWCWPGFSPDLCSVSVIWGNGQCQPLRWTIHPLMRECCCMQGIQSRQTIPERSSVVILFGHSRKDEETGTHADIVLDVIRVQGELLVPRCVGTRNNLKTSKTSSK